MVTSGRYRVGWRHGDHINPSFPVRCRSDASLRPYLANSLCIINSNAYYLTVPWHYYYAYLIVVSWESCSLSLYNFRRENRLSYCMLNLDLLRSAEPFLTSCCCFRYRGSTFYLISCLRLDCLHQAVDKTFLLRT